MTFEVLINVMPRSEISDPQGQAVERALPGIGFQGFSAVRIGKRIRLFVDAENEDEARAKVGAACERVLANPVIEEYEVELLRGVETASSGNAT